MKKIILLFTLIVSLASCSDQKSELLKCDKPWNERTDFEKIIGSWCTEKYNPGVGRTVVSQTMEFQTKICFYSDHTMKEFQLSDSYIVLDPCKAGQIYENRLGLNNFTAKWEKGEPLVLKNVWQYCRKASGRDKQQPAESTT